VAALRSAKIVLRSSDVLDGNKDLIDATRLRLLETLTETLDRLFHRLYDGHGFRGPEPLAQPVTERAIVGYGR
jgi:hypothetical protein